MNKIKQILYSGMILSFFALSLSAQPTEFLFEDKIYKNEIRSVKLHIEGLVSSYPIIDLGRPGRIKLSFDDMDVEIKRYMYKIIHCNADWTQSDLEPIDYIDGFEEEEILEYDYAFNTSRSDYTHYDLFLPNADMAWEVSGNYLLLVWDDEDDSAVLTRRFMVAESLVSADIDLVRANDVTKLRTHHEFDFNINVKNLRVNNHETEIKTVILQNGRWDIAQTDIRPTFRRGDELVYDYQDKILFPAMKEFRNFDIRSVQFRNKNIFALDRDDDNYYAILEREVIRSDKNYLLDEDLNGQFVIHNLDEDNFDLESEYVNVLFTLMSNQPLYEKEIYIFGALTDWKIDERFRLGYDDEYKAYMAQVYLKQGFYDYIFVTVSEDEPDKIDYLDLEGSWYDAENDYNFLVYYRPLNELYDRLVGVFTYNPSKNN